MVRHFVNLVIRGKVQMTLKPLGWQKSALKKYHDNFNLDPTFVLVAGTGSGKTKFSIMASTFASEYHRAENPIILIVTPWRSTKRSFKKDFAKEGLRATANNNKAADPSLDAIICTYASAGEMMRLCNEMGRKIILVLDEFHHLQEGNKWSEPYKNIVVGEGLVLRAILMSGTPWCESGELTTNLVKYDKKTVDINGKSRIEMRIVNDFEYTYGQAVGEKDEQRNVVPVEIDLFDGEAVQEIYNNNTGELVGERTLNTKTMTADDPLTPFVNFTADTIRNYPIATSIIDKSVARLRALRKSIGTEYVGGMLIAMGKDQGLAIKEYLKNAHQCNAVFVFSDDPKAHDAIDTFEKDVSQEFIISVDLISEGVDVPRIKVIGDLSNKRTLLHIIQRWGRALRRARKPNDDFLVNPSAYVYCINHPRLAYAAEYIENEIKQYQKEEGDGGGSGDSENASRTKSQTCDGIAATWAHGNAEDATVSDLATWLWETNYRNIRDGRRGHTDCYFTARLMIEDGNIPEAYCPDGFQPEPASYDDLKSEAVSALTTETGKLAFGMFDGSYSDANSYLNRLMGIRKWDSSKVSLEEVKERTAIIRRELSNYEY
jgi:superfamily II DNA or RNA helicase